MDSLWDRLPPELVELILQHRSALVVQRRWLRVTHYAHARRPIWSNVQRHLCDVGAWPRLALFPMVRREWRQEPGSWLAVDAVVAHGILQEARQGMWGPSSRRLEG